MDEFWDTLAKSGPVALVLGAILVTLWRHHVSVVKDLRQENKDLHNENRADTKSMIAWAVNGDDDDKGREARTSGRLPQDDTGNAP